MVQNKQIYFRDIEHLKNKIMYNIEVPQYWDVASISNLTQAEKEYTHRLQSNVVYLELLESAKKAVGADGPSVYDIETLFTKFGDINVSLAEL